MVSVTIPLINCSEKTEITLDYSNPVHPINRLKLSPYDYVRLLDLLRLGALPSMERFLAKNNPQFLSFVKSIKSIKLNVVKQ